MSTHTPTYPTDTLLNDSQLRSKVEVSKQRREELSSHEIDWGARYQFLKQHGYTLRPRYEPEHQWSWRIPGNENVRPQQFIDEWATPLLNANVVDAVRDSDKKLVYIKKTKLSSTELQIAIFLTQLSQTDPRNHCVPILEIIRPEASKGRSSISQGDSSETSGDPHPVTSKDVVDKSHSYSAPSKNYQSGIDRDVLPTPGEDAYSVSNTGDNSAGEDTAYIVMPFLRGVDDPPWETVRDIIDFVDQILEGLAYLHSHGIAHRDCARKNLMMDATTLFPKGFHPARLDMDRSGKKLAERRSRTPGSVKYYFVDFGLSTLAQPGKPSLVLGRDGLDQEVPELSLEVPYDAFKVDIFIIGNVFKVMLCDAYTNTSFLLPLVASMTRRDPSTRPTAVEAERQWKVIRQGLSSLTWLWRLKSREELWAEAVFRDTWGLGKSFFAWITDTQG